LCDYLQADELMHVKTGTRWVRRLTDDEPERRDQLADWGRSAVARIEGFYADNGYVEHDVRFTFKGGGGDLVSTPSSVVGE
jgi:hypothetical protein